MLYYVKNKEVIVSEERLWSIFSFFILRVCKIKGTQEKGKNRHTQKYEEK